MRMWDVNPAIMCRQHLLGEHSELHMFIGTFRKRISFKGYLANGLIDTNKVKQRHEQLVTEMTKRGYNHRSPIDEQLCADMATQFKNTEYDFSVEANLKELLRRCDRCRQNYEHSGLRANHFNPNTAHIHGETI